MSAATVFGSIVGLQVLLAVIIPIITSTQLSKNGECYLSTSGNLCDFVNISSGFSLLFSLLLSIAMVTTLRERRSASAAPGGVFLPSVAGSVASFGLLWWLAVAISATSGNSKADDAGLPEGSARDGVSALAWVEFVLFLAAVATVAYDRIAHSRHRVHMARKAGKLSTIDESVQSHQQFQMQAHGLPAVPDVPPPAAIVTAV